MFSGNPIVIVTVTLLVIFGIFGLALTRHWDRIDNHRLSIVPLCGKDGHFRYEVIVFTGMLYGSGLLVIEL